jgi:DNA-binding CsgD family transcriptional regulator
MTGRAVVGREAELRAMEAFLDDAARGPVALRLAGDAGIGKTTLWSAALQSARARGARVLVTRPAEAEARLSFAGLSDLVEGAGDDALGRLPRPQRTALDVALLRAEAGPEGLDERAVNAAVSSLLRLLAAEGPVLVAVDDAQWLDRPTADALAFALRRLEREPVGLAVTVRTSAELAPAVDAAVDRARRRVVRVGSLSLGALHRLVKERLGLTLPRPTLVRVEAASAGNPFHALEIARALGDSGDVRAEEVPVPEDLRNLMTKRIRRLPEPTRDALLTAAALSRPTTVLVAEADLAAAEEADVVRIEPGGRIRFTHPLLAAAVYERASEDSRRALHRRLAAAVTDPEERARHLALGAEGPDEAVASALDEAAAAAWARGATQPAAELLDLALALSRDPRSEVGLDRRLRHAEALLRVGDFDAGRAALAEVLDGGATGDLRGRALLAAARFGFFEDWKGAIARLEDALGGTTDPVLAAKIHAVLSWLTEDLEGSLGHARAGLATIRPEDDPAVYAYLELAQAMQEFYLGLSDDRETVRRAAAVFEAASPWEQSAVPMLFARMHDDFARQRELEVKALAFARDCGDVGAEAHALASVGIITGAEGDLRTGLALTSEAVDMAEAVDMPVVRLFTRFGLLSVLIPLGRVEEARAVLRECAPDVAAVDNPIPTAAFHVDSGALLQALGDHAGAAHEFSEADGILRGLGYVNFPMRAHGDLAESVLALGELDRAEGLIRELEDRAARLGTPWVTCVSLRGRGLLQAARGDLPAARRTLERSIAAHDALDMPLERGRTLLAAGRVERRARQWGPARRRLEEAAAIFRDMGAELWLGQAQAELARVAARPPAERDGLSATERQVADLVATGLTNRQIADALFQSPKTVEAHLTRIYRKLGVRSRAALVARMGEGPGGS